MAQAALRSAQHLDALQVDDRKTLQHQRVEIDLVVVEADRTDRVVRYVAIADAADEVPWARAAVVVPCVGVGRVARDVDCAVDRLTPSPDLAEIVGKADLPRSEVVSKVWEYIKTNKLQDEKDRRQINADDKLGKVFGGKRSATRCTGG